MNRDSIQQFFRENPRAWLVGVVAMLALAVSVWGIWGGFSLQFGSLFAETYCNPSDHSQPAVGRLTIKIFFVEGIEYSGGPIPRDSVIHFDATGKPATGDCLTDGSGNVVWTLTPSGGGEIRPRGGNLFTPILKAIKDGTYQVSATLDGINSNTLTITIGSGGPTTCPTPPTTSLPATLSVVCGTTQNVLTWQKPRTLNAAVNSVIRNVNGGNGVFVFTEGGCWNTFGISTYTDTNVQSGNTYTYRVKTNADAVSNTVTCGTAPTSTVTPTPTATATPVYPLLQCAPLNQTVALNQVATVTATGGSSIYQWDLSGSGVQQGGTATSVGVSYSVPGQKVVRVSSAGQIATCVVVVTDAGSSTQSSLTVIKSGVNTVTGTAGPSSAITINPNEMAQFTVSITNNGTTVANGLRVIDTLPGGMSYRIGTTTVNGQAESADTITSGGLALGSLEPGANVNVQWSATADSTGQLSAGPHQSQPRVLVTATDIADTTADMSVTVYGSGFAGSNGSGSVDDNGNGNVGTVATGPGEAVTIALVMAAALTLLYSGYTRSTAYRRHEADTVSQDQGPMDFRS